MLKIAMKFNYLFVRKDRICSFSWKIQSAETSNIYWREHWLKPTLLQTQVCARPDNNDDNDLKGQISSTVRNPLLLLVL